MKLDRSLHQHSYLYFILFLLAAVFGFWVTYFSRILEQENYRMHAHGACLILWCLMLITQALLIRIKKNVLHKIIGKFSYVLVPLLLFTTLDLFKYRLRNITQPGTLDFMFVALVVNALIIFLIFYGLAIYFRKQTALHARFMLCTIFPMFSPITDRIINIHIPSLLKFMPMVEGVPLVPVAGFLLADVILLGLYIWDWKSQGRLNVFPFALLLLLCYHVSFLDGYKFQFWRTFGTWFLAF